MALSVCGITPYTEERYNKICRCLSVRPRSCKKIKTAILEGIEQQLADPLFSLLNRNKLLEFKSRLTGRAPLLTLTIGEFKTLTDLLPPGILKKLTEVIQDEAPRQEVVGFTDIILPETYYLRYTPLAAIDYFDIVLSITCAYARNIADETEIKPVVITDYPHTSETVDSLPEHDGLPGLRITFTEMENFQRLKKRLYFHFPGTIVGETYEFGMTYEYVKNVRRESGAA